MYILRGFRRPKGLALSNTSQGQPLPISPVPSPKKKVLLILGESKRGLVLKAFHFTEHNFINWSSQSLNVLECTLCVLKNIHSYQSLASFSEDKVPRLHIHKPHVFTCSLQPSVTGLQCISCKTPIKTPSFQFWTSCENLHI